MAEEQSDSITRPGEHFGHRRDPSWRRGVHEGALLALRLADAGWTREELSAWLAQLGDWRFDDDAGSLPPEPRKIREAQR